VSEPEDAPSLAKHPEEGDVALRAMTDDHAFRVVAVDTTRTAAGVVAAQGASGETARVLAELVTATILMRETMSPDYRVQGILKARGGSLVADTHPDGGTRGLAQVAAGQELELGPGSLLQMMRSLPNGGMQQGIVDVDSSGRLSVALMTYFQESEQVVSVAALGARLEGGQVLSAGGFVVQLLPEPERALHAVMTARLEDFPSIESFLVRGDFGAKLLLEEVLYGMPHTMLGAAPLRYACRCSEATLLGAIATLGRQEIESLVATEESLEIRCDYCHKDYVIASERLRSLLEAS
jgi:molecular chaperone Hsp33